VLVVPWRPLDLRSSQAAAVGGWGEEAPSCGGARLPPVGYGEFDFFWTFLGFIFCSKYFQSLKEMCLGTTDGTLWIWLVPLLYAIKEKAEDPFFSYEPPSQVFKQLRVDEEKQRWV